VVGQRMIEMARRGSTLTPDDVLRLTLEGGTGDGAADGGPGGGVEGRIALPGVRKVIQAKTAGQAEYMRQIAEHDIVVGIGPAGTGKTYLAVAMAVDALIRRRVRRIILARPAVEAGESLGFLPVTCRRRWIRTCARSTTRSTR
jgi:phosphate starvation-inducible PhoH-like protein